MPDLDPELLAAVALARANPQALAAVDAIYAELAAEVDARKPRCDASGKCCHFEEYGHRLYVTTLELARFVATIGGTDVALIAEGGSPGRLSSELSPGLPPSAIKGDGAPSNRRVALPIQKEPWMGLGCPFQLDGLCSVRGARPFGCRIYFCDPSSTQWQQALYERLHGRLRALHDELGVPYRYVEWRHALRALGLADKSL